MTTFDRHLLREWLGILGIVLIAVLGLLFVQVAYDEFRHLSELGARPLDVGMYILVTVPSFLTLVLPLVLLVSLLFALGQLHRANEFTAMRAAGVGFFRLTLPVWIVGVLCCGLSWWLNATVVPWSVEESRALEERLQFRHQALTKSPDRVGAVGSVVFDNPGEGRVWFLNRYSRLTGKGYGVTVSLLDEERREERRLVATQAEWHPEGGWTFVGGHELVMERETGEVIRTIPFPERFMPEFHEDPNLMLLIDRRPKDLTFFELRRLIEYFKSTQSPRSVPYEVRYFSLLADALVPLIVIALAVPFAVSGVRVNPAVGVSKSIALFLLYYVLANVGSSLATKAILSPEWAAWLPNLGMASLGGWLFLRLR